MAERDITNIDPESDVASDTAVGSSSMTHREAWQRIVTNGLWSHNPGLVQLLGLCPLLAVSNSVVNSLGLALATLFTLLVSNGVIALIRSQLKPHTRIMTYVLVIATSVTLVDLALAAWRFELHKVLGLFIPLIVTNCMIIGRAEAFASRNHLRASLLDALAVGAGFALVLIVLGGLRELVGHGSLLRDAEMLFGPAAASWQIQLFNADRGLLIALLPPGAFILLGLMVAAKNVIDLRLTRATHHVLQ